METAYQRLRNGVSHISWFVTYKNI